MRIETLAYELSLLLSRRLTQDFQTPATSRGVIHLVISRIELVAMPEGYRERFLEPTAEWAVKLLAEKKAIRTVTLEGDRPGEAESYLEWCRLVGTTTDRIPALFIGRTKEKPHEYQILIAYEA